MAPSGPGRQLGHEAACQAVLWSLLSELSSFTLGSA